MATSEQKVKAIYPRASKRSYKGLDTSKGYYLIWSGYPESRDSRRLGEGKTASQAWADAAQEH